MKPEADADINSLQLAAEQGKDSDAAQTLSNLSQNSQFAALAQAQAQAQAQPGTSGPNQSNPFDAGPSSHPRGPPNLGQLSALASQSPPLSAARAQGQQEGDEMGSDGDEDNKAGNQGSPQPGTKRGGRSATMGSEEWTRQRKDNHVSFSSPMFDESLQLMFLGTCRKKSNVVVVAISTKA